MLDGENARKAVVTAALPIFTGEIRRTVAFQRAALDGTTVDQVKSSDMAGSAWRDYETIGEEILNGKGHKIRRR